MQVPTSDMALTKICGNYFYHHSDYNIRKAARIILIKCQNCVTSICFNLFPKKNQKNR